MNFSAHIDADARLIILRELAEQPAGRLNSSLLTVTLESFGHNRSRDWVHTQIHALRDLGAVDIVEAGTVLVATITRTGLEHVARRRRLVGVAVPAPGID